MQELCDPDTQLLIGIQNQLRTNQKQHQPLRKSTACREQSQTRYKFKDSQPICLRDLKIANQGSGMDAGKQLDCSLGSSFSVFIMFIPELRHQNPHLFEDV